MNEEKKFVPPMAEVVDFTNDDIITDSGAVDWRNDDNWEDWKV